MTDIIATTRRPAITAIDAAIDAAQETIRQLTRARRHITELYDNADIETLIDTTDGDCAECGPACTHELRALMTGSHIYQARPQ